MTTLMISCCPNEDYCEMLFIGPKGKVSGINGLQHIKHEILLIKFITFSITSTLGNKNGFLALFSIIT